MAYDRTVLDKKFVTTITLGTGVSVKPGDVVAHNGSAWVLADADTPSLYGRFFATQYGAAATVVEVAREVWLEDLDAPFTVGNKQYLSATAGEFTATRPTTDGQLRQVLGQALTTSVVHLFVEGLREVSVPIIVDYATSANALLDSGDFGGPTLDAQNEVCVMHAIVPENAVAVEIAKLYLAAEATVGTPTFDLSVSSAIDGAQWDAVVADTTIANSALEGAAADEMQITDITTAFDATNIIRPGAILGLKATKDDAGTDISIIFGGVIVFNCV